MRWATGGLRPVGDVYNGSNPAAAHQTEKVMRSDKDFTPKSADGERCNICKSAAQRKVSEVIFDDDPMPIRHEYTAYLCLEDFNKIMRINGGKNEL